MTYHCNYRVRDSGLQPRPFYIVDENGLFYITRAGAKPRYSNIKAAWKKVAELNRRTKTNFMSKVNFGRNEHPEPEGDPC